MPNIHEHCDISRQRTGLEFRELHQWIDHPPEAKYLGPDHRKERHAFTVKDKEYIEKKFGFKAVIEWLFHIAIDNISTAYKFSKDFYGPKTYNLIKIGISEFGTINVDFSTTSFNKMAIQFKEFDP